MVMGNLKLITDLTEIKNTTALIGNSILKYVNSCVQIQKHMSRKEVEQKVIDKS